jgi:hypothetical protein
MKAKQIVMVLFVSLLAFGCKEKKEAIEDVVEKYNVNRMPNASDTHFAEAVKSMQQNKDIEAADHIKLGVAELEKEGKDVEGLYKVNLNRAEEALKLIATDLNGRKKVSLNTVREMVANAEINVAHDYLSSDQAYVLDEPEQVASRRTSKKFNENLSNLKKEEGKMKDDAKKEGEALLKEGKKLEEDYKAWEKKAAEYAKKTDEHFKKYYPTYYQQNYWMY